MSLVSAGQGTIGLLLKGFSARKILGLPYEYVEWVRLLAQHSTMVRITSNMPRVDRWIYPVTDQFLSLKPRLTSFPTLF